jgi:metal-responsive CopG/Arc/MetJ family transcriptional regulator
MKNVQISFDQNLLKTIDRLAASYKLSRSAIVGEALKNWVRQREIQEFEEAWIRKLKENPDDVTDSETWLQAEQWDSPRNVVIYG